MNNIILLVVLLIVATLMLYLAIATVLKKERSKYKVQEKKRRADLTLANQLYLEGRYSLSVTESFKAIETSLRFALDATSEKTIFDLIQEAQTKHKLDRDGVNAAHFARMQRNQVVHEHREVPADISLQVYNSARTVLKQLS